MIVIAYWKCDDPVTPLVRLLVGWSVVFGRSVILSSKGRELHFHAPIGDIFVIWCFATQGIV